MKNKHNAGDKVIFVYWNEDFKQFEICKAKIDSVTLYVDQVEYYLEGSFAEPVLEKDIFNPSEAIEFLSNYINKENETQN